MEEKDFDGHNGTFISKYLAKNLAKIIIRRARSRRNDQEKLRIKSEDNSNSAKIAAKVLLNDDYEDGIQDNLSAIVIYLNKNETSRAKLIKQDANIYIYIL